MDKLSALVHRLLGSLWFLPALIVFVSAAAAVGLVELQAVVGDDLARRWPRLFGAGAAGAQGMLSAIATSMITVAGVVFSVTVVALSLASSQYSPRVLRSFMSDRPTQVVLGVFVGVFTYCLIVLRTIRAPDEVNFVPSLAVLGGVLGALAGVGLLIYFIHHLATAIQAPYIVARIAGETRQAIDRLFPADLGESGPHFGRAVPPGALPEAWRPVAAPESGYLVSVDGERLLGLADRDGVVVRIEPHVGDFVIEQRPLAWVSGDGALDMRLSQSVCQCFDIRRERNVHQDAPFGVQQLVDIALKALSPGIHDPTTAATCIDRLGELMCRLAGRHVEGPYRCSEDGRLRVIAQGPDHEALVTLAFAALIDHAGDHLEVCERLLDALDAIADVTPDAGRRAVLDRLADALLQRVAKLDTWMARREALLERGRALRQRVQAGGAVHGSAARPLPFSRTLPPRAG